MKQSVEERTSAVRRAEDGAADLKKRVTELSQGLEEFEKEYQVNSLLYKVIFSWHAKDIAIWFHMHA